MDSKFEKPSCNESEAGKEYLGKKESEQLGATCKDSCDAESSATKWGPDQLIPNLQQTGFIFSGHEGMLGQSIFDHIEKTDSASTLYLKFDHQIPVATALSDQGLYLSAGLARVPWKHFEETARAVWPIIFKKMNLPPNIIHFDIGLLMGRDCFFPAARFKIAENCEPGARFDEPSVQEQISDCIKLLGDIDLWRYKVDAIADDVIAENIQVARESRLQLSAKQLSCNGSIENKAWAAPIILPRNIAENRPLELREMQVVQVGHATGFCSTRRLFHFQKYGSHTPLDINFDAEMFWERIRDFSTGKRAMLRVTWTDCLEGSDVRSRTLVDVHEVEDPLC